MSPSLKLEILTTAGTITVGLTEDQIETVSEHILNCMHADKICVLRDAKDRVHGSCRGKDIVGFNFVIPANPQNNLHQRHLLAATRYYEQMTASESWKQIED